MCGIVGIINGTRSNRSSLSETFDNMFFMNQLRGFDGGGVLWYNMITNKYQVVKDKDFQLVWKDADYARSIKTLTNIPFVIGHNRAATRGSVATENNHPFDEGDVVLVHNGTMSYIPKKHEANTVVDSHAIAKMINDGGTEAFVKDSFGAYALAWFGKQHKQLHLLRNKDRPLWLIYVPDAILISSEPGIAVAAAQRNGIHIEKQELIAEHKLYTFEPFNLVPTITDLTEVAKFYSHPTNGVTGFPRIVSDIYGTNYDDDEDEDAATALAWAVARRRNESRTNSGSRFEPVYEQEVTFHKSDKWEYFKLRHDIFDEEKKELCAVEQKDLVKLVVGEDLLFSLDSADLHGSYAAIKGNIPNVPMHTYEVRGHVKTAQLVANENSTKLLTGRIKRLEGKDGKFIIQVKGVEWSSTEDPQYAGKEVAGEKQQ